MGNNLSILATTASINVEQGLDQTINSMGVKQKKKKKRRGDFIPNFPGGSGWGKTRRQCITRETEWLAITVPLKMHSDALPALFGKQGWMKTFQHPHQHYSGQVLLIFWCWTLGMVATVILLCIKSLCELWHGEQAWWLGIYTLWVSEVCIGAPNSLNAYCWFKVGSTGEIPSVHTSERPHG